MACVQNYALQAGGGNGIEALLGLLPNKAVADILVDSFLARVDWYLHVRSLSLLAQLVSKTDEREQVLHIPTFRLDYATFWETFGASQPSADPTWLPPRLATIFMVRSLPPSPAPSTLIPSTCLNRTANETLQVLALGLHFIPPTASPYSAVEGTSLPLKWIDGAEKALGLADWIGRPQLRSVQTILMMAFYWHNTGCVFVLGEECADCVRVM